MFLAKPLTTKRLKHSRGFTLLELTVTSSIAGIFGAVLLASSQLPLGRDQANSAVAELTGWLDSISARAQQFGPCTVTFTSGSNLRPGSTMAQLSSGSDPRCASGPAPIFPDGNSFQAAVVYSPSTVSSLNFSRRGGAVSDGVVATVRITANNARPLRCLRIDFNSITLGSNNSANNVASQDCTVWNGT